MTLVRKWLISMCAIVALVGPASNLLARDEARNTFLTVGEMNGVAGLELVLCRFDADQVEIWKDNRKGGWIARL